MNDAWFINHLSADVKRGQLYGMAKPNRGRLRISKPSLKRLKLALLVLILSIPQNDTRRKDEKYTF